MTENSLADAVARGAALLDRKRPGWESEIDLAKLDIASTDRCVTAQLSGEECYRAGMEQLDIDSFEEYVRHGFARDTSHERTHTEYRALTELWSSLIRERLLTMDVADV